MTNRKKKRCHAAASLHVESCPLVKPVTKVEALSRYAENWTLMIFRKVL